MSNQIEAIWVKEEADLRFSPTDSGALDVNTAISRYKEYAAHREAMHRYDLPRVIYPEYHILSGNKKTRNWTLYPTEAHVGKLDKATRNGANSTGQYSFTKPYPIPVLHEHKSSSQCGEDASPIYGRIIKAKYIQVPENGHEFMAGLGEMTHPQAIEEILSNRWLTNSLGSAVTNAECSICGHRYLGPSDQQDHEHQVRSWYRLNPKNKNAKEDMDYEQVDSSERGAMPCYTNIKEYMAREYSRVITPSDDEALVRIKDTSENPDGYFGKRESADVLLWVPMGISSSNGVSEWGERYIDLGSGRQVPAKNLGLFSGRELHEHVEKIEAGEFNVVEFDSGVGHTISTFTFTESISQPETTHVENTTDLDTDEGKLSTKKRDSLKTSTFCGPGRSFPVPDKAHYTAALRLLPRSNHSSKEKARIKACIERKGRQNGWTSKTKQGNPNEK